MHLTPFAEQGPCQPGPNPAGGGLAQDRRGRRLRLGRHRAGVITVHLRHTSGRPNTWRGGTVCAVNPHDSSPELLAPWLARGATGHAGSNIPRRQGVFAVLQ